AALISAATASAACWLMSAIATLAPFCAYSSAIALPRPLAAPVIRATLPLRLVMRCSCVRGISSCRSPLAGDALASMSELEDPEQQHRPPAGSYGYFVSSAR